MPVSLSQLPPDLDRVLVLANPKAGSRPGMHRAERLVELLRQRGVQSDLLTDLAEATRLANQWHCDGCLRALVGVGGDGTAAELVNRTMPGVPITMLPAGNENLLARHLRLPSDPAVCCDLIAGGAVARLDAGAASGRIFLLMIGCGFDAEVVRRVHGQRTGHIGRATYVKPILDSLRTYGYPELHIEWDEEGAVAADRPRHARWLFAFNLPCYGGGLRIAPQADGADGLLDVCTLRRGGVPSSLWYAANVILRRHRGLVDFAACRTRRLRVTSDAEVPYQLDGDPGGVLPVEIETLPGRLTLIVPRETCRVGRAQRAPP